MPETVPPPPQNSSLLIPAHPLIGREENMKLLFDKMVKDVHGTDSWSKLEQDLFHSRARLDIRSERSGVTFDKVLDTVTALTLAGLVTSVQTGEGQDETSVGAEETANAGISVSAQAVATSLGNLASALVPIITAAGGIVTAQTLAALLPTVVSAAGQAAGTSGTTGATK
jgi:hypothetical protein